MENIQKYLMSRLGYSEQDAYMLCGDLEQLDRSLVPLLTRWVQDGTCSDDTEYNGYSLNSLCADCGMNFVAALLTLDWLIKEPEQAVTALRTGIL